MWLDPLPKPIKQTRYCLHDTIMSDWRKTRTICPRDLRLSFLWVAPWTPSNITALWHRGVSNKHKYSYWPLNWAPTILRDDISSTVDAYYWQFGHDENPVCEGMQGTTLGQGIVDAIFAVLGAGMDPGACGKQIMCLILSVPLFVLVYVLWIQDRFT